MTGSGASTKASRTTSSNGNSSGSSGSGGGNGNIRDKQKLQTRRKVDRLLNTPDNTYDGSVSRGSSGGSGSNSGVFDGFDSIITDINNDDDDDGENEFDESKLLDFDAGDYYGLQAQAKQAQEARAKDEAWPKRFWWDMCEYNVCVLRTYIGSKIRLLG